MIRYSKPHLLSEEGSDRGTAYAWTNKIVSAGDLTHVVWTDSVAKTRGRTFNHKTQTWSSTVHIGNGVDNHNDPALTLDAQGRLRIVYGPHGPFGVFEDLWPEGVFKHHVAPTPSSFEGMGDKATRVGCHGTYASLVHTPQGFDAIVYRGGEHPPMVVFQRERTLGGWEQPVFLMAQDVEPGYTHTGPQIFSAPDGTLYVTAHFYARSRGHSQGVAILRSQDQGRTWTDLSGRPAELPIRYEARFAVPHPPAELDPRNMGCAVDSKGQVWAASNKAHRKGRQLLVSRWIGGGWETIDVGAHLPAGWSPVDGGFSIDAKDRLHVAVTAVSAGAAKPGEGMVWGCPTGEVFHLCSADAGKTWHCGQVSPTDPKNPNWLPSIVRAGPFHPVTRPAVLYTNGQTGLNPQEGCKSTTITKVYCVFIEMDG